MPPFRAAVERRRVYRMSGGTQPRHHVSPDPTALIGAMHQYEVCHRRRSLGLLLSVHTETPPRRVNAPSLTGGGRTADPVRHHLGARPSWGTTFGGHDIWERDQPCR